MRSGAARGGGRISPPLHLILALGRPVGEGPIGAVGAECYFVIMNVILLVIVFLLLFGGGGFYIGGPAVGGGGLGLVLLICLIVFLMGGFRTKAD